ncbi:MAG: MFS transporter, partial [Anaerolineales bacterium]
LPDPHIADSVGLTALNVGWLLGVNRLARILFNGPVGALADRLPRRVMLLSALGLGVLSTLLYAVANSMTLWLLSRVVWGLAWSGIWIVGQAALLDVADDDTRGRLSGLYQMWFFIGVGGAALLAGVFTDWLGFRGGLVLSTALTGLAWLLWWLQIPATTVPITRTASQEKTRMNLPQLVGVFRLALPVFVIRFVFAGVVASTTILWLQEWLPSLPAGWEGVLPLATLSGSMVALRTISSLLGANLAGKAVDQLDWRWRLIAWVLLLGAVGMWVMADHQWLSAIVGAQLGAVAGSAVQTVVPALVGDRYPQQDSGRVLGLIYTLGDLASALGPPAAVALMVSITLPGAYRLSAVLLAIFAGLAIWEGMIKRRVVKRLPE